MKPKRLRMARKGLGCGAMAADHTAPVATSTPRKRGPAPKIQQQLERVAALPKAQQKFVSQMLDTVLAQSDG